MKNVTALTAGPEPTGWRIQLRLLAPVLGLAALLEIAINLRGGDYFALAQGLIVGLLLLAVVLAREIGKPVENVVVAAADVVRGNHRKRVATTAIRELNELAGAVNDMAENRESELASLARQALHDPLTRLANRTLFMERLAHALERAQRGGTSAAVMFLDVDNFKTINDSFGHQLGDHLLVEVAERLQSCLRGLDTAARFGGDEFTVLLEDVSTTRDATRVADRIQAKLQVPFAMNGQETFISASIGIAISSGEDQPEGLLRAADLAMYRAKNDGKARYALFDKDLNAGALQRSELEADLRRALERGQLKLFYQPVVRLDTGAVSEVEALLRWDHPTRGLVAPGDFIPLAEQTGLILPIGQWVLTEACRQARGWQLENPSETPLTVDVNISGRQLRYPKLLEEVATTLRDTGLDPGSLKLESSERAMMQDAESTIATLKALKSLGVKLAIDNFGTGYSSLAYLKRFPIDTLKIDRSFIEELGQEQEDSAVARAIITLAKTLNLGVTGEGIETGTQYSRLRALGCDRAQGFYFARPLPNELGKRLSHNQIMISTQGATLE